MKRVGLAAIVVVLVAMALGGCTFRLPAPAAPHSPVVTPAGRAIPGADLTVSAFPSRPMPTKGGGPMLWPTIVTSQAEEWATRVRYGFVNAEGRRVAEPIYTSFDTCVDGGLPTHVVASRSGAIDVLSLDGSVALTMDLSLLGADPITQVMCRGHVVAAVQERPTISKTYAFDLATGAAVAVPRDSVLECPAADLTPKPLPPGYPTDAGGRWVMSDPPVSAMNLDTSAVVTNLNGGDACWGSGDFLSCWSANRIPMIYDRNGALTPFGDVEEVQTSTMCATPAFAPSYYWATSGTVQGYVDSSGAWYYQEPVYQTVEE